MSKRNFIILFVFAAMLRLGGLGAANFWYDELFTVRACTIPLGDMMQALSGDVHPPLFYLLMRPICWLFGPDEFMLRLFSGVIPSLLALWFLWRLADRLHVPQGAQYVGLVLMAVMPMQIHFAQEFRMYNLLLCFVLAALIAVIDRRWWLVGLSLTGALYTHNYGLIYLPILALIAFMVLGLNWRRLWPGPVLAFGLPVMAFIPWTVVLAGQMATVSAGYWIQPVTFGAQLNALNLLFWGFSVYDNLTVLAMLLVYGTLLYGTWYMLRNRPKGWAVIILMVWGPLALAVIGSSLWKPILLFRGLIASAPMIYLMIGLAFGHGNLWRRAVLVGMLVPCIVGGLYAHYKFNPVNKGEHKYSLVDVVRQQWQPGDMIYHTNDNTIHAWMVYGSDLQPQYKSWSCDKEPLGSLSDVTRQGLGYKEVGLDTLEGHRVWVIVSDGPTSSQCDIDRQAQILQGARLFITRVDDEFATYQVWIKDQ